MQNVQFSNKKEEKNWSLSTNCNFLISKYFQLYCLSWQNSLFEISIVLHDIRLCEYIKIRKLNVMKFFKSSESYLEESRNFTEQGTRITLKLLKLLCTDKTSK